MVVVMIVVVMLVGRESASRTREFNPRFLFPSFSLSMLFCSTDLVKGCERRRRNRDEERESERIDQRKKGCLEEDGKRQKDKEQD